MIYRRVVETAAPLPHSRLALNGIENGKLKIENQADADNAAQAFEYRPPTNVCLHFL
jgi:hypothetical protein